MTVPELLIIGTLFVAKFEYIDIGSYPKTVKDVDRYCICPAHL